MSSQNYELIGTDPFNHEKIVRDLAAFRQRQIAKRGGPQLIEPITAEIIRFAYRGFHTLTIALIWLIWWTDDKLKSLADIK